MLMKKESFDGEEIKVNKRRTDKVYFESAFIQSISDKIDFLREESKEILKELDSTEFKQQLDDFQAAARLYCVRATREKNANFAP